MELDFWGFRTVILLYYKSNGTKINEFFSQGTYNFQKLKKETFAIADYKRVNISKFDKFTLKSLVVFIQSDNFKICNMLSSFSNKFILNKASLEIFTYK